MIFTFLEMRWEVTSLLTGLIFLDTITGALKAKRLGIGFRKDELWWGITIKILILMIPHLMALIGKIMGLDWVALVNLVVYIMIANEFTSILTNILSIKKKELYKNFDFIELLFNWLKDLIRGWAEGKLKSYK
ncbi:phage holin family protein [Mongoliitalea lutea]|nr:phage holin family protein [Mongoliitalea lutea]